jgi:hypothetical protein
MEWVDMEQLRERAPVVAAIPPATSNITTPRTIEQAIDTTPTMTEPAIGNRHTAIDGSRYNDGTRDNDQHRESCTNYVPKLVLFWFERYD